MTIVGHRINGKLVVEENSRLGDVYNPATGEVERQVALASVTQVDNAVKGLTSIIEPIVIVFMGLIIGGIVLAVFMPMLTLVNGAS